MWNHVQNMRLDTLNHLYTDDVDANLDAFLHNGIEGEGFDQPSLAFLAHHLRVARAMSDRPNVHLFHYDKTSQNLQSEMQRVARAIGLTYQADVFDRLVEKATFKSMKANAAVTAPGGKSGLYKDPSAFFKSGTSRKWEAN